MQSTRPIEQPFSDMNANWPGLSLFFPFVINNDCTWHMFKNCCPWPFLSFPWKILSWTFQFQIWREKTKMKLLSLQFLWPTIYPRHWFSRMWRYSTTCTLPWRNSSLTVRQFPDVIQSTLFTVWTELAGVHAASLLRADRLLGCFLGQAWNSSQKVLQLGC